MRGLHEYCRNENSASSMQQRAKRTAADRYIAEPAVINGRMYVYLFQVDLDGLFLKA